MKRNGSALLIVLGVLSFLVVSAVAFSAFMRRARQPSSYLRRSVASRQLAKAALAEAIDQIDRSIANGVHPGVGGTALNTWRDRVFFMGEEISGTPDNDWVMRRISKTTPTLTLEGLAYIPPPLVNEARYWSRLTPTAAWQAIPYDVGRFAYCAIDVSDYFDVNRLVADYPRSSAANRRVTITHLFEQSEHSGAPTGQDAWDKFMEKFRDIKKDTLDISFDSKSKMPFVSVADFNLALFDKGSIGNMKSPFGEFVENGASSFYPGSSSAELRTFSEMTFVTDGWFPAGKKTSAGNASGGASSTTLYDISDPKYQPYEMSMLKKGDSVFLSEATIMYKTETAPSEESKQWYERLSGLGMAALADYLDEDSEPISLAVPTTERVPMICGIEPKLSRDMKFGVRKSTEPEDPNNPTVVEMQGTEADATSRKVKTTVRWNIDAEGFAGCFQGGRINTLVAYPFLHANSSEVSGWNVDGKFSLFLSSNETFPFRTRNENDVLHLAQQNLPDTGINNGVMNIKLDDGCKPSFSAKIASEEDAVKKCNELRLDGATNFDFDNNVLLQITYTWTQSRKKKDGGGFTDWVPKFDAVQQDPDPSVCEKVEAHTAMQPLTVKGEPDPEFADAALSEKVKNPDWDKTVCLNAAVWLRVKKNSKVVDMVPASLMDDKIQNSVDDPYLTLLLSGGSMKADGDAWPVLKFSFPNVKFKFSINGLSAIEQQPLESPVFPKAIMVPDPRHNHAPENWFADQAGDLTEAKWLAANLTDREENGDIFMATSDAGYLQSIYELAFIPRFTNLRSTGNSGSTGNYNIPPSNWNGNDYPTEALKTLNANFMWRTYDPIDIEQDGGNREAFADLPFTSEGTGMKVNPYSNSTNVLMAAFANTPVDWRFAHTNGDFNATLKSYLKDAKKFNQNYAWNDYSSESTGGRFSWVDLEQVAGRMITCVRQAGNDGWVKAWNNMGWYDFCADGKLFDDIPYKGRTQDLWDADRKFLYGFWRDCFGARQQLFLVFVRAEPLLLGGGSADQLPPQLGARAVALVWRDPSTSGSGTSNGYPHRTRVLFYRPLD